MTQFVGRDEELGRLMGINSGNGLRTCIVYGPRRIGTSTLIREFCRGKRSFTVCFPEGTPNESLSAVRRYAERFTSETFPEPGDFEEAFGIIGRACGEERTIVVLDGTENADSAEFRKALAGFIESNIKETENMLVVGISYDGKPPDMAAAPPLKGLIAETVSLGHLPLSEIGKLHGKMKPSDVYRCYLTVGGIPLYHSLMNKPEYESCVEKCFLGSFPRLCAEAENVVRRSSVPYAYCSAILSDITKGYGRPVDLASNQGISRQLCNVYLRKMEREGLIARVHPVANAPKKPVFIVRDALMDFYHTAIRNNPDIALQDRAGFSSIEPDVRMFLELRFRRACRSYLGSHFDCKVLGGWWCAGESSNAINPAAVVRDGESEYTLICDCKFRKGKIDIGALENLKARAELVRASDKRLAMFSFSGFDGEVTKAASKEGILLIGPEELIG